MKNPLLTKEIIRHIFSLLGLTEQSYGKIGLTIPELKIKKTLTLEYDNKEIVGHSIFVGEISFLESKIKALVIDLSQKTLEFLLLIRMDNLPIFLMSLILDEEDYGTFRINNEKNIIEADLITQSMVLNGIEKVSSYGFLWNSCSDYQDLYSIAISCI